VEQRKEGLRLRMWQFSGRFSFGRVEPPLQLIPLFGATFDPVWSKNSCGAGIELEQSSEPLATHNPVAALLGFIGSIREKELVAFVSCQGRLGRSQQHC
jgi:hypothetical protein